MNPKKSAESQAELSRIVIDIPKSQHRKFKALAAARGKSMKIIINEFINEWVNKSNASPTCMLSHSPNATTRKALKNVAQGKNLTRTTDLEDLLKNLDS